MLSRSLRNIHKDDGLPPAILIVDSLKAWYDAMDIASYPGSGTTWYDLSGNGNNCSLINGPTWDGSAISFDGSNDYAASASVTGIAGTAPRTMSCWLKMSSVTATSKSVMKIGGGPDGRLFELLVSGSSTITGHFYGATFAFGATIADSLADSWHNIVLSYDGVTAFLYCNGSLIAQYTKVINTTSAKFQFGIPTGSQSYNCGKVSQAMLYNRWLTHREVLQNFLALKTRYGL